MTARWVKWTATGLVMAGAGLGMSGCATGAKTFTDPERARIDEYERAAEQILRSREIDGRPPAVRIGAEPDLVNAGRPTAYFTTRVGVQEIGRPGVIVVNRAALADDYIAQAVLSRELAHYVLRHADGRCQDRRLECEIEANSVSVELLMTGWELSYSDAVRLQYAYLKSVLLAVQRGDASGPGGSGDPCRELQEFATRFKASASCE